MTKQYFRKSHIRLLQFNCKGKESTNQDYICYFDWITRAWEGLEKTSDKHSIGRKSCQLSQTTVPFKFVWQKSSGDYDAMGSYPVPEEYLRWGDGSLMIKITTKRQCRSFHLIVRQIIQIGRGHLQ